MTEKHGQILVVDDDVSIVATLRLLLKSEGYQVLTAQSPQEAEFLVKQQEVDLVLMDLNYSLDTTSGQEGLALISALKKLDELLPVVVMTGWASIDIAVQAMQRGAGDFVQKPWENERLLSILDNQLKLGRSLRSQDRLSSENQLLKSAVADELDQGLVAESPAMRQLLQTLEQVAASDINILLTGENGTGKSLMAQYIHRQSARFAKSIVSVNMGSITETLFESEMFGHVKGAFTDAKSQRIGRFELADGGSLFLDEIGNIPLSQQAKLLRVLEEQQFEKVGSSKTQRCDVRVISATNADLPAMVEDGRFRMDLLYRMNTLELRIPALRERPEDVAPLTRRFVAKFAAKYNRGGLNLTETALAALSAYHWPGNIRELSHMIERAVLLTSGGQITEQQLMLPGEALAQGAKAATAQAVTSSAESGCNPEQTLEDIEKQAIVQRLAHFDGNANKAAQSLGLGRSSFYRRLDKYQI